MNKTEVEQQIAEAIEIGTRKLARSASTEYSSEGRQRFAAQAAAYFAKATALGQQFMVSQTPLVAPMPLTKPAATESLSDSLLGPR